MYNHQENFNKEFQARVKRLRLKQGLSPRAMAELLDVPTDTYRKWETENMMPQSVIPRFALATGVSIEFVLTGKDRHRR
jgi:DNA-binding transcriptional regulator YiaG